MRFLKALITTVIVLGLLAIGVYFIGTNLIADQVMDKVTTELESSGQMDVIRQEVKNDPELRAFIEEGKNADPSKLPFQTKEEATRALLKKFNVSELNELQSQARNGMTAAEQQQLMNKLQSRLSEEELLALKAFAYKELCATDGTACQ
ncbi:hypothetical protein NCCP2222_12620 [Sporosarcina sp. NCCP-2222]|uniref:hypothetical protein n=1 Tax=Sporosarcina sp. NCCP-2222 TaxID=2935073 RepID=UPI002088C3F9|nr:hypothetical protein [Sporosarcina sp. NCCP-2222]GKV55315.1 hypothetical protein NCCP2222_12620 [Sporosarcina sp. NCCP-2222]